MSLRYRDLGPVELFRDHTVVQIPGRRLTAALSLLLIHANRPVSTDALVEAVWGDDASQRARQTLAAHLWRLRGLLEPERGKGVRPTTIVNSTHGYQLQVDPDQSDASRFERLADAAAESLSAGSGSAALRQCDEALSSWRGLPWTPHDDEPWAAPAVGRLVELRAEVQQLRIQALLKEGHLSVALADLQVLLHEHPLRERLWVLRMLAMYRSGRTDDALAAFAAARRLVIDELGVEPGPELRDLQAHILADDPALQDRPRSLILLASKPGIVSLPRRRDPVIGRSREIDELVGLLSHVSLLTVVGTAGCGKTTVAIEAARQLPADFPDGIWFVDLTAVTSRDQLVRAISAALPLHLSSDDIDHALRTYTRSRRMLLVLDNCEQVLDDVADLLDALLEQPSRLAVLATSREPLNINGERVVNLLPLPSATPAQIARASEAELHQQPALQLLLSRLDPVRASSLSRDELEQAAAVCAAVDGVPLAIELAAAQARAYTLPEILAQVQTDLTGLARVGRGGSPQHASLRAAIDLSAATLNAAELELHRAVAVVPGPLTSELAAALVGTDRAAAATALTQLSHRSMLSALGPRQPGRPSRFSQLATLRAHAQKTAPLQMATVLGDRRDAWVATLLGDAPRPGQPTEIDWFHRVDDDLAAVRTSLQSQLVDQVSEDRFQVTSGLGLYWYYRGMLAEWEHWTRLALAQTRGDTATRLELSLNHGAAASMMGRTDPLARAVAAVQETWPRLDERQLTGLGDALFSFGNSAWSTRDTPTLVRSADTLSDIAAATDDVTLRLLADVQQLSARIRTGSTAGDENVVQMDRLWTRAEAVKNRLAGWSIASWATFDAARRSDFSNGMTWSDRALQLHRDLGSGGLSVRVELRAALYAMAGKDEEAVRLFTASQALARRAGLRWPGTELGAALLTETGAKLRPEIQQRAEDEGSRLTLDQILDGNNVTGSAWL